MSENPAPSSEGPVSPLSAVSDNWGLFVAMGVILMLLGFLALGESFYVTLGAIWLLGVFLMVGGVLHVVHAMYHRSWGGFFLELLLGILYVVGGIACSASPGPAAVILTLFLGISILLTGASRVLLALMHRTFNGWGVMLVSGVISCALGGLILAKWPASSFFVIGIFISIELIVNGASWVALGLTARQLRSAP